MTKAGAPLKYLTARIGAALNRPVTGLIAMLLAIFKISFILWKWAPTTVILDFSNYYIWALAFRLHINPYTTDMTPLAGHLNVIIGSVIHTNYPPTCLLLLEPLTLFKPLVAYWIWIAFSVVLFIVTLALMLAAELPLSVAAVVASLAVYYRPIDIHFEFGQLQLMILLLLILVIRELERRRDVNAGLLLAGAGLLKAYPLFLVIHFLCYRRWRAVVWTAIGVAVGFALTLLVLGPDALSFFGAFERTAIPGRGAPMLPIVSISGVIFRIFTHFFNIAVVRAEFLSWIEIISLVISGAVLSLAIVAVLQASASPKQPQLAFGLLIATMVLITPIAWPHYMVLLLLPLSQLAIAAYRGEAPRMAIVLGVVAYLLPELAYQTAFNQLMHHGRPVVADRLMEGMPLSVFLTYTAAYFMVADRSRREPLNDAVAAS